MGSSMSCVPQHNFRFSSKSFIRRNSSRLFRKKYPQEGQEKSNSIINILCTVTPRKEMSPKDLQAIENIKWDPPFPYDPVSGWKKSSINVKNYGRMIHSSKVRFRFLHCQDVHDCYLDLFQTHLHFVSNNTTGLTYQGTLPLKELTICKLQNRNSFGDPQEFAFQINGVSLNPIIVYCSTEEEMNNWFGLLKEQIEANGGSAIVPETYTRIKVQCSEETKVEKEELRNSISKEPIYEWEGLQRESLGPITYATKVRLQHMPCQEQYDRLLVLYPNYLIILSEESDGLFYKGKLPLNMITVTTPCQDIMPNTFMIEGELTSQTSVARCYSSCVNSDWLPITLCPVSAQMHMRLLTLVGFSSVLCVLVQFISSRPNSSDTQYSAHLGSRSSSFSSRVRPAPDHRPVSLHYSSPPQTSYLASEGPMSPVYNTPYSSVHCNGPVQRIEKAPLVKVADSFSSRVRPAPDHRPVSLHYSSPPQTSYLCFHSFRLCTPPLGRKIRHGQALEPELVSSQWSEELLFEDINHCLLLLTDDCYLRPVDPDDQEMDYDNIWEFDPDNGMIQPLPGPLPHRTPVYFGAQGLGTMTTQQRWS
uniref:Pleckstrin homology domain-containing family N member 1-like n=1 Tax=Sinocyclocheilus grahami TaxID=75366 RepID=A0A672JVU6_SINGR